VGDHYGAFREGEKVLTTRKGADKPRDDPRLASPIHTLKSLKTSVDASSRLGFRCNVISDCLPWERELGNRGVA